MSGLKDPIAIAAGGRVDIAPFALPHCAPGEMRFEEPRDIVEIRIAFRGSVPADFGLSYLRRYWPQYRREDPLWNPMTRPFLWGWFRCDDQFTCEWQRAAITLRDEGQTKVITFKPLTEELPDAGDYAVNFRRTLGFRIEGVDAAAIEKVQVFTTSPVARTTLRVAMDAGKRTDGKSITLSAYNVVINKVRAVSGVRVRGTRVCLDSGAQRAFEVDLTHLRTPHPAAGDEGQITFTLADDAFTISLDSLEREGPIWYEEQGIYITRAGDTTTFDEYRQRSAARMNLRQMVVQEPEQTFANALFQQPRPQIVNSGFVLGCKYARQTFRITPYGDVLLDYFNVKEKGQARDTSRFKNTPEAGKHWLAARFLFGLERWFPIGCYCDPAPVIAFNVAARRDGVVVEQKSIALPLLDPEMDRDIASDEPLVALVRFRFTNTNPSTHLARLTVRYSQSSSRTMGILGYAGRPRGVEQDDYLVPVSPLEPLRVVGDQIRGQWNGEDVLRCTYCADTPATTQGQAVVFEKDLAAGEVWEVVLKIPFIALDTGEELAALGRLEFERSYQAVRRYWHRTARRGAHIRTPVPQMNELFDFSMPHQEVSDSLLPDGSGLINVATGTSTYRDYPKETALMTQALDERGLHDEARRRLGVWLRFQGTKPLPGMYTDCDGVFFGSGGFEGMGYNQHHGWILWSLAQHFFLTGDRAWFESVAPAVVKGADWIIRQRRNTMQHLPHSRGWECGFLPAGALEDIEDYHYWLSTNVVTWWGMDHAARALSEIDHPEAARIQREADAYMADLRRGLQIMRRHTPLVRLRDGRWVPRYPSRIYRRGRDIGWIREVYEGALVLLITGFLDPRSKEAGWILDDYHDNLYTQPPYGYFILDFDTHWFSRTGFCPQPNWFPDVLPFLDRDEPEVYIWMVFNAWCAVWQQELCGMAEHATPCLGFHNPAVFKNSEELMALKWLLLMYVYAKDGLLHLGRALPRAWLADGEEIHAIGVATIFGPVSVRYQSFAARGEIVAEAEFAFRRQPERILVRIRHPQGAPIRSVTVNGQPHAAFDPAKGDIDLTGCMGRVRIVACYGM